jgi:hypothetical protein
MKLSDRLLDANRRTEYAIAALRRLPHREYLRTAHWYRTRILALVVFAPDRIGYSPVG